MPFCSYHIGCIGNSDPVTSNLHDFSFITVRLILQKVKMIHVCLFINSFTFSPTNSYFTVLQLKSRKSLLKSQKAKNQNKFPPKRKLVCQVYQVQGRHKVWLQLNLNAILHKDSSAQHNRCRFPYSKQWCHKWEPSTLIKLILSN